MCLVKKGQTHIDLANTIYKDFKLKDRCVLYNLVFSEEALHVVKL